jgi:hypothetical protein
LEYGHNGGGIMTITTLLTLDRPSQNLIFGIVGKWLNYDEIKELVHCLNILKFKDGVQGISPQLLSRSQFLINAIQKLAGNREEQVTFLFHRLWEVSQTRDTPVIDALIDNHLVANWVCSLGNTPDHARGIHERFDWILTGASCNSHPKLFKLMVNNDRNRESRHTEALMWAAGNNAFEFAGDLLEAVPTEQMDSARQSWAINNALLNGNNALVRTLWQRRPIVDHNRSRCLDNAIDHYQFSLAFEMAGEQSFVGKTMFVARVVFSLFWKAAGSVKNLFNFN